MNPDVGGWVSPVFGSSRSGTISLDTFGHIPDLDLDQSVFQ